MRWRRRTDDARRMKGDPPPTYAELVDKVAELEQARLALLHQCELLDARNERLHHDVRAMRERLPQLAEPVYDLGYLSLPLEVQQAIEASRADPDVTRPYVRKPIDETWPEPGVELR